MHFLHLRILSETNWASLPIWRYRYSVARDHVVPLEVNCPLPRRRRRAFHLNAHVVDVAIGVAQSVRYKRLKSSNAVL